MDLGMELSDSTLITSKTDLKGRVTYCNKDFLRYSGFSEDEVFGKPHNIVRHKDMPKAVFKILWDYVKRGEEVFAFVKNRTKDNGHYWVFANVTPSFDMQKNIVGYYSVRRKPNPKAIKQIAQVYRSMLSAQSQSTQASYALLEQKLSEHNMSYNHFILSLQERA
nr:PAS domain-containing protein [Helicobacter jaachi]